MINEMINTLKPAMSQLFPPNVLEKLNSRDMMAPGILQYVLSPYLARFAYVLLPIYMLTHSTYMLLLPTLLNQVR